MIFSNCYVSHKIKAIWILISSNTYAFISKDLSKQIIVIFQIQIFLNGPSAKLIKQDHSSLICVDFCKSLCWVCDFDTPIFHYRHCLCKLFFAHPFIKIWVNSGKGDPVFVILPDVFQKVFEFGFWNKVIANCRLCFEFRLGSMKCSLNNGFKVKPLWKFNDFKAPFFQFRKTQVFITIDIKFINIHYCWK